MGKKKVSCYLMTGQTVKKGNSNGFPKNKICCETKKRCRFNTLQTSRAEALSVIGVPPMPSQK
jgi:hypothetical protein